MTNLRITPLLMSWSSLYLLFSTLKPTYGSRMAMDKSYKYNSKQICPYELSLITKTTHRGFMHFYRGEEGNAPSRVHREDETQIGIDTSGCRFP
jgi:hypothetical protein